MVGRLKESQERPNKAEKRPQQTKENAGETGAGGGVVCGVYVIDTWSTLGHKADSGAPLSEKRDSYTSKSP